MRACSAISPALCILALTVSVSVFSNEWQMAFPVTQEGRSIASIMLATDGKKILYFQSDSLLSELDDYFSSDVKSWLSTQEKVTPQELQKYGINFKLNPQTLQVDMELATESSKIRQIGLDSLDSSNEPYSTAASWSWQNNFNLAHQQYRKADFSESSIDWLGGANIGGENGINAAYSFYLNNNSEDTSFYRGRSQIFYDNTTSPWRLSAGDVEPVTSGHLPGVWLGGVSWERAYSEIQPYRQLRNSGTQALDLEESAEVTIYVNDIRITRVRLTPGRYEFDDLPLTDGANDVRLEIQYASGRYDVVTYSQFYNGRLLKAGLSDFSLALGVENEQIGQKLTYGDKGIVTGFYEYGFTESLTLGVNALSHQVGHMGGISLVNGSDFGNFTVRASTSYSPDGNEKSVGYATSIDYSQQVFGASTFGSPNLRISYDWQRNFNPLPWKPENQFTYKNLRADYQWFIDNNWDANIFASYRDEATLEKQYNATLKLNWRNDYWRISLIGEYAHPTADLESEHKGYITAEFFYDLFSSRHRFKASYNSELNQTRLEIRKPIESLTGDYGYELSTEHQDGDQSYLARGDYNANRWRGQVEVENLQPKDSESDTRIYGNLSSSLVIADGHVAWGRAGVGANAIVDVHPTLGDSDVEVNSNFNGQPEAVSTSSMSNVVPLSRTHQNNTLSYSVPNAPIGYSLGAGIEHIKPGSMTTHIITVGSDATRTVIATATTKTGEPIALLSGRAVHEDGRTMPVFTNSAGRFVLDGASSGTYFIKLGKWYGRVNIKDDDPTLLYLEDLIMETEDGNYD